MKAVILCAGKSSRSYPLTLTRPKPLLPVMNRPLLEHNLRALKGVVDEVVLVVGYRKEMIKDYFGESFSGMKISYVSQDEQLGTAHALQCAKSKLKGRFIVLNGDDLYSSREILAVSKRRFCILAKEVDNPQIFGVLVIEGDKVKGLIEKPQNPPSNLINAGLYMLDDSIFDYRIKESQRGEYELVDYITYLASFGDVYYEKVKKYWIPIGYPWHILDAHDTLLASISASSGNAGFAKAKDEVIVGEGTKILPGTHIKGPAIIGKGCAIGPNSYIGPGSVIGDNCKIGHGSEIISTTIFPSSTIGSLSSFSHSIIGKNVELGKANIVSSANLDGSNVSTIIKGKPIDTQRKYFGTAIADDVSSSDSIRYFPGSKVWPGMLLENDVEGDVHETGK